MKDIIHSQVAENDFLTTGKSITGTHTGTFPDIRPTKKKVIIDVIDSVKIRDWKYFEHRGLNPLPAILAELAQ